MIDSRRFFASLEFMYAKQFSARKYASCLTSINSALSDLKEAKHIGGIYKCL